MSRSAVLAHIVRDADGTAVGAWGRFTLRTAFQPIFVFHGGKLFVAAFEGLNSAFPRRNAGGARRVFRGRAGAR